MKARRAHLKLESAPDESLTGPVEDYLKTIYEIGRGTVAVATNDIAQRLDIAPASVSGMVRRLAEQGLLGYDQVPLWADRVRRALEGYGGRIRLMGWLG